MKHAKMLGPLAVAAAAVMAFAGVASATYVTSPSGVTYTSTIKAEAENGHTIFHSENAPTPFTVECNIGLIQGKIESHGLPETTTATGSLGDLAFNGCTNQATVVVTKPGSLEVHTDKAGVIDGNGTVTSSGAEITIHVPVLNIKCTYTTNKTDVATLTGSKVTGGTATLDINSATIPRTGGPATCGTGAFWTGTYKVVTPDYLDVD